MPHTFPLTKEVLKRKFAVYVVIARGDKDIKLYVGKTGDNREGCNPIISRCGNHFSYNPIHSQLRNKLLDHESRDYVYVFEHFDDYPKGVKKRRAAIDRINEVERWVNDRIQKLAGNRPRCILLNPYKAKGYVPKKQREQRKEFRTLETEQKIDDLVKCVQNELENLPP